MISTDQLLDLTLQYNTQGFVHLKQLLPRAVLEAARGAFDAAVDRHSAATDQARASGKRFHDLPVTPQKIREALAP